ncbi:MAG: hypothetical protein Fur0032_17180 [Terrimicrobiaceae bacterium]
MSKRTPTVEEETDRLLAFYGDDRIAVLGLLERQLGVLHMRAQVIIGFAAVAVTTTGFSGRLIAGTNQLAQFCIIAGLGAILSGCFLLFLKVLAVDWIISRHLQENFRLSVADIVLRRNRKTQAYRAGTTIVFIGFLVYALSIAIMLLNPVPLDIPTR